MRDKIIFVGIFSFLAGIFFRSFLNFSNNFLLGVTILSFVFLIAYIYSRHKSFLFILISLIFLVLGVLRFDYKDSREPKNIFDDLVGREVSFVGVVSREPDRRENNQRLVVRFDRVNILITTDLYPEFYYGDKLKVFGVLRKPENFKTQAGKDFDYINYLSKDSVYYNINFAEVEFVAEGEGSKLMTGLLKTKDKFLRTIEKIIPDPESSLLGGLLLGTKQSLGKDLEQDFIDTGLIHIVVLSGYNVTIVAEAIIRTLVFLPATMGIVLASISIFLFAVITGAGATIVRASIMAILALIARVMGNSYNIIRALVVAGFLMVLHNPYILYFDLSFQLSFLASLGLIYLSPIFEKNLFWFTNILGLRQIASATLATQVFVLPFILYKMGTLSIIAPITNLIILPLIPLTMLLGFLTGVMGLFSQTLAMPLGYFANLFLKFEILIVKIFADFSFSAIQIHRFSIVFVLIIYVFIFWILFKNYKIKSNVETK